MIYVFEAFVHQSELLICYQVYWIRIQLCLGSIRKNIAFSILNLFQVYQVQTIVSNLISFLKQGSLKTEFSWIRFSNKGRKVLHEQDFQEVYWDGWIS